MKNELKKGLLITNQYEKQNEMVSGKDIYLKLVMYLKDDLIDFVHQQLQYIHLSG